MSILSRRTLLGGAATALLTARVGGATNDGSAKESAAGGIRPRPIAQSSDGKTVRTGGSRTIRIDGGYNVWVKQVGFGGLPMLTLHGGPGGTHFYYECFEDFLPGAGLSYLYYDQLGCGFSDVPDDKSLWTIERYITEVEQVRRELGLPRLLLYGHSWGAMLAMEYAVRYPEHVGALVISNMVASISSFIEYSEQLIRKLLPPADIDVIMRARASGNFRSPEYEKIVLTKVYSKTACRLDPWPEPLLREMRFHNPTIYNVMCGPDDLNVVGNLKNWDIWDRLHKIAAPTLLIAAQYDEMSPEQMKRMSTLIPKSQFVVCPNSGHFAMYDNQRAYFDALIPFMRTHSHASSS